MDSRRVSPKTLSAPAIVSLREEVSSLLEKAEAPEDVKVPVTTPAPAALVMPPAPVESPGLDERFRPPADLLRPVTAPAESASVPAPMPVPVSAPVSKLAPAPSQASPSPPTPERTKKAAPLPTVEVPQDPPTQKRPAPVPNSLRRSRPASVFPWSTVLTAVLGMAGIFLLGSIYFIDVEPAPDDDLALNVAVDTAPKIAGPERLEIFLQAVNTLPDAQLALKSAWRWDERMLQSFMQGNGAAVDALRDLLGDFDWHPHHAAWHAEDLGEHRSWPHVRILLQARVVYLTRTGKEQAALDAALDLGRLSLRLQEMWSWPSYAQRAQELHMACVQTTAQVLKDTRLSSAELKVCQDELVRLAPSDELLQGALNAFYLHEKKLLFGENSGEPLDTMPNGVLRERPGRLFFKKQETLGLFAEACRHLRDEVVEAPFSAGSRVRTSGRRLHASMWFQPNGAGQTYFAQKTDALHELLERHHLGRARHALVLSLFAIRRSLVDHQRLPSGLTELRPDYLAEVPLDPFSGELLHYDPLNGVLFSVGDDFRAEGGHITDPPMIDPAEPTLELGIAVAVPVQAGP